MGYYTTYRLSAIKDNALLDLKELEPILDKLLEISHYSPDDISFGEAIFYDVKWYDHQIDMTTLSMLYPTLRFDLHGDGEEEDDEWEDTYINGRHHRRDAHWDTGSIDDFDPALLEPHHVVKLDFLKNLIPNMESDNTIGCLTDIL